MKYGIQKNKCPICKRYTGGFSKTISLGHRPDGTQVITGRYIETCICGYRSKYPMTDIIRWAKVDIEAGQLKPAGWLKGLL